MCPLNAWRSKTDTHNTHSAVSSLEKLSHGCVFLMCDVFGAVDAPPGEQDEKENEGDHLSLYSRWVQFWSYFSNKLLLRLSETLFHRISGLARPRHSPLALPLRQHS